VAVKEGVAHRQNAQIWAHGEPGSYVPIDAVLADVRLALSGVVAIPGGIRAEWAGDSEDLPDDGMGTIARYSSYVLIGTDQ